MKILIIQERGRHEANREFREALCLKRGIERAGHEAIVWGLNYDNFPTPFEEISRDCDAILSLENYDTGWHPDISSFKGKKLFWSIDSHCAMANHQRHCMKHKFDTLLMSNIHHAGYFRNLVNEAVWFPNGYPSDLIKPDESVFRGFDIGFCGSLIGNRDEWLQLIESKFRLKRDIFMIGDNMVKALSSYKIAFNLNIGDDVNFRTFEATGSGALLLTNYTPNLEHLFIVGDEIVTYNSPDDLLSKIQFLIENESIREKIAKKGYERSKRDHSYDRRSIELIKIIEGSK
jgi:hypothetical protein